MNLNTTPIENYGRDHWSLLAYIHHVCIGTSGVIGTIDHKRMRCNEKKHPLLSPKSGVEWQDTHSTRLADASNHDLLKDFDDAVNSGAVILGHDDWDCLDDFLESGLIEILSLINGHVRLTPHGAKVGGSLLQHKSKGGAFSNFHISQVALRDGSENTKRDPSVAE